MIRQYLRAAFIDELHLAICTARSCRVPGSICQEGFICAPRAMNARSTSQANAQLTSCRVSAGEADDVK